MATAPRKTAPAAKPAPTPLEVFEDAATEQAEAPSFDDLVAETEVVEETPEQRRIKELQNMLLAEDERQATNPTDESGRPVRTAELTEEQKQIRELEDRLAKKKSQSLSQSFEQASSGEVVHINFVKDGFTAGGSVWYRGQEVVYDLHGEAYALTKDRLGNSWVDLAGDTAAQYDKFGDEYFRPGPFIPRRGEVFNDSIANEDLRRGKAAPVVRL